MEIEENEERSKRVNIRIATKQYQRMMAYGEVLGLESDSAVIKHFLNLGLQFGGAALSAQITSDTNVKMLKAFEAFTDHVDAIQTDLVQEASRARA